MDSIPEAVSVKVIEPEIVDAQPGAENRTIQSPGAVVSAPPPMTVTGAPEESLGEVARRASAEKEKQQKQ